MELKNRKGDDQLTDWTRETDYISWVNEVNFSSLKD